MNARLTARAQALSLRPLLEACGYTGERIRQDFRFGGTDAEQEVALATFAYDLADARNACIAVVEVEDEKDVGARVGAVRELGAPVVFACRPGAVEWWIQGADGPRREPATPSLSGDAVGSFFDANRGRLAPESIYRAKTLARYDRQLRLPFVDEGLMPLIERDLGRRLGGFVEEVFAELRDGVGGAELDDHTTHQLLQDAFWLLAAKILRDKGVPSFADLDCRDAADAFARVEKHYGEPTQLLNRRPEIRAALQRAARGVVSLPHLGQMTTEALAYVYEHSMVSPELRKTLGIHSTPPYLVDYVLAQLEPWIAELPVADRHVFEPACGHGAFLVAAMRRLRVDAPGGAAGHAYLQAHLCGLEVDVTAREIARLSMTLTDIPNPDGWRLERGNMFHGDALPRLAARAKILLANPPFEDFKREQRNEYARNGTPTTHWNRAEEMLARTLPHLPPGGMFGVVVPQGMLHSKDGRELRRQLVQEFELSSITLLPDKVFECADVETAILVGRRFVPSTKAVVQYRGVRNPDLSRFQATAESSSLRDFPQERFDYFPRFNLQVPDLDDVWTWARTSGMALRDIADVGEGFSHVGAELRGGAQVAGTKWFPGAVRGYEKVGRNLQLHQTPRQTWVSLRRSLVSRPRYGTTVGIPQVMMSYVRVSRGPWRLKAVIDRVGMAVKRSFLVVRPAMRGVSLEMLWALCNSPFANAYTYTNATERHNKVTLIREMPIPRFDAKDASRVGRIVRRYFKACGETVQFRSPATRDVQLQSLLLDLDAEILRLYDLPVKLEQDLLGIFAGENKRPGVHGEWEPHVPPEFQLRVPFYLYHSATAADRKASRASATGVRARPGEALLAPSPTQVELPFMKAIVAKEVEEDHGIGEVIIDEEPLPVSDDLRPSIRRPSPNPAVEIEWLYDELGELKRFVGMSSLGAETSRLLRVHREERTSRLRWLQQQQAADMASKFRANSRVPPIEGDELLERAQRLLRKYENSPAGHGSSGHSNSESS